ncbi:FACT complex subunit Ssrp1-like [Oppia nitens]|uniref:FACT complex subunit Ssrp1-like n=1 Tax=Oppia nitens TaxID=1686743 RepID=UPI0023DB0E8B|nr:FACT complex subunit Ssrp1-like [Oppia nitens]
MTDYLEYNDASKEERGSMISGRLKLTGNQIIFKSGKTGKVETLAANDIDSLGWQRMAGERIVRVMNKSGQMSRFGGFVESDYEKLKKFFDKNYELELQPRDNCLRGWNWGTADFDGNVLGFDIKKNERAFEVPLLNVSHCTTAKNEVTLEFHQNDEAPNSLMEMRFHIPTIDGVDTAQSFMEQILSMANIIQATGDAVVTFKEIQCLTPRGRYDIKIFPTFIQLHGKTFDYKIPITSVLRLFQLPHKDSRQVFFVMSLDPPIKQGQTRYHFLILLFSKEDELAVDLGMSERDLKEKYEGKLQQQMSGPVYELLAKIMRVLVQRKITLPDPTFCSVKDVPVITCSYRASAGLLYPLDRGFIYLHKPPIHIRFEEIISINFARSGGSTRSFDFEVETKSAFVHTFSSIEKEEYSKLFDFVSKKNLKIKNRGMEGGGSEKSRKARDEGMVDSDLEDEPDAYLQRVREEGRIRTEAGDDSDESDESFNPDKESDGSVAEEFDSNASASSSEDSDEEGGGGSSHKKKKKEKEREKPKKKEKKEKKRKEKSSKKDKDENKPKRPMSAYMLWFNDNRDKIREKYPKLSFTEIAKKGGELWKELKDKPKWDEKAAEAKKQYEKAMESYNAGDFKPKSPTKKSSSSAAASKSANKSPTKSGSFKSKEYISDSDSSSSDDSDRKESSKKSSSKSSSKSKDKSSSKDSKKPKKEESDVEMEEEEEEESAVETPESSDESD